MSKFIIGVVIFVSLNFSVISVWALPRPGDFRDAAEEVDVPPEHRAAPPQPVAPPSIPTFPRAVFPLMFSGTHPLFLAGPNNFVPYVPNVISI